MNSGVHKLLFQHLSQEELKEMFQSSKQESRQLIKPYFKALDMNFAKTPYELKKQGVDLKRVLDSIVGNNIMSIYLPNASYDYMNFYIAVAHEKAFLLTLEIIEYRKEKNRLPADLTTFKDNESDFFNDPFSNQMFIYKNKGSDFILYSLGRDFEDNGGDFEKDLVFWPVQYTEL